jgi:hypothetical protein
MKFRIPLDTLAEAVPQLGGFPYEPEERVWEGKTLFIKGDRSKCVTLRMYWDFAALMDDGSYINSRNTPVAKKFFPNMVLETLDTAHWGWPFRFSKSRL